MRAAGELVAQLLMRHVSAQNPLALFLAGLSGLLLPVSIACSSASDAKDDGGASSSCSSLAACCAEMASGDKASCNAIVSEGLAEACSSELVVYQSSNLCGHSQGTGSGSGSSAGSGSGTTLGTGTGSGTSVGTGTGSGSSSGSGSGSSTGTGSGSGSSTGTGSGSGSSTGTGSGSGSSTGSGSGSGNPPGTEITAGNDLTVYGVTSNGFVVYYDHAAGSIDVVSLAGGAPTVISASPGANFTITTNYGAVVAWTNLDANNVGTLIVWTQADGAKTISAASQSGSASVDSSSRYIVFGTNTSISTSASTCDIDASLTDGTSKVALVQGVEAAPNQFFGIAGDYAVLNTAISTSTSFTSSITSYALGTWVSAPLVSSTTGFNYIQGLDAAGTEVLVVDGSGSVDVYPIGGGTPAVLAAVDGGASLSGTFSAALLSNDGKTAFFAGADGAALDSSLIATPATKLLATGTALSLYDISPTDHTLLAAGGTPQSILFGSATTEGSLTTVTPVAGFGGAAFARDSSHILFYSETDTTTGIGTLNSFTVGSKTQAVIDTGVGAFATFGTGPDAVLSDNVTTVSTDIKFLNTSSTTAPTIIVAGAQPAWALTQETTTRLV